jgi:desulfoferrodoxin (superoxide reductase-like protein)
MSKTLGRRSALQTLFVGTTTLAFARLLDACSDASFPPAGRTDTGTPPATPAPTDNNEYMPGTGNPVSTGDSPPMVPNPEWEARAKQLEDAQTQQFGFVFTATAAGPFVGKERSHVPSATVGAAGMYKQVTVLVNHVMGANGVDAGGYDAGDAGDAGKDSGDAGDAGKVDAGDAGKEGGLPPLDASAVDGGVHYITTIYLRGTVNGTDTVVGLWEFVSTDPAPPSVKFTIPTGITSVVAYEHCTLHGLWKSDPLAL